MNEVVIDASFLPEVERTSLSDIPEHLLRHTIGTTDLAHFQRSALEHIAFFEAATLKHDGKRLYDYQSILDFGCGTGRLMQMFPNTANIKGCDPNGPLVKFCNDFFKHAEVYQSQPEPPLKWADGTFDLVYSFSVFSHLKRDSEERWLKELARVGKPGCIYLITVQGDWWLESKFPKPEREQIQNAGFWYFDIHTSRGTDMDFPENYGSSIHTSDFIRQEWSKHMDVLQVYKGRPPMLYDHPSLPEAHRRALEGSRSMGQDMVIMRKR